MPSAKCACTTWVANAAWASSKSPGPSCHIPTASYNKPMKITLHPYGPLLEVIGPTPQEFACEANTASELLNALHTAFADLQPWKGRIALAIGERLLAPQDEIAEGVEVALIPPVSGG